LRKRFNGFDFLVALIVVVGLLFLARRALTMHHGGNLPQQTAQQTVVFTLLTAGTSNASGFVSHFDIGGDATVPAGGARVSLGTLTRVQIVPDMISVPNGHGGVVALPDPTLQRLQLTIKGKGAVAGGKVTVNGTPFLIGQGVAVEEGGAEVTGYILNEQVR